MTSFSSPDVNVIVCEIPSNSIFFVVLQMVSFWCITTSVFFVALCDYDYHCRDNIRFKYPKCGILADLRRTDVLSRCKKLIFYFFSQCFV